MKTSSAILLFAFVSNHKETAAAKPSLRATTTDTGELFGKCFTGCHNGHYAGRWYNHRSRCTCDANWTDDCCKTYDGECTEGMTELCAQSRLVDQSFSTSELLDTNGDYQGPITLGTAAAHGLPVNMQGVFWLQDQEDSSSLVSFATSRDGEGLSVWNHNSDRHISVRVSGDRVWSCASKGSAWQGAESIDLVYHFEGTPKENPTHFRIVPEAQNIFGLQIPRNLLVNFEMNLIEIGTDQHYYPADGDRPAAVMFDRPNEFLGFGFKRYQVAQVINGEGKPTSAYDAWVAYNQGTEDWQDGTIWYHDISMDDTM